MRRSTRHPSFLAAFVLLALALLLLGSAAELRAQDGLLLEIELEKTQEILERLGPTVQQVDSPKLAELFKKATDLQRQAWQLYRSSGPAASFVDKTRVLRLTRTARDMATRIHREIREQISLEERAPREIERARQLLERVREGLGNANVPRVRSVVDEAARQIQSAESQLRDRNFEVALRLAQSAQTLLRGVAEQAPRHLDAERVERELRRSRELLDRAHEHLSDGDGGARRAWEQARRLQDRAENALRQGRPAQALELTQQCRTRLRQLLGDSGGQVQHEDVQRALDRFDAELERLRSRADGPLPLRAQKLVDEALGARGRAMESLQHDRTDAALTQLRLGFDLLRRAGQFVGDGEG